MRCRVRGLGEKNRSKNRLIALAQLRLLEQGDVYCDTRCRNSCSCLGATENLPRRSSLSVPSVEACADLSQRYTPAVLAVEYAALAPRTTKCRRHTPPLCISAAVLIASCTPRQANHTMCAVCSCCMKCLNGTVFCKEQY